MKKPVYQEHPRLYRKCLELTGHDAAARMLCVIVVETAENEGEGGIIVEGEALSLPRHVRRMKLHKLMGPEH
jgi:hypothetical protein